MPAAPMQSGLRIQNSSKYCRVVGQYPTVRVGSTSFSWRISAKRTSQQCSACTTRMAFGCTLKTLNSVTNSLRLDLLRNKQHNGIQFWEDCNHTKSGICIIPITPKLVAATGVELPITVSGTIGYHQCLYLPQPLVRLSHC